MSVNDTTAPVPTTSSERQVIDALTDAAGDILGTVEDGDEGLRNAIDHSHRRVHRPRAAAVAHRHR